MKLNQFIFYTLTISGIKTEDFSFNQFFFKLSLQFKTFLYKICYYKSLILNIFIKSR